MNEERDPSRVMTDEERARALRAQVKSLHTFDLAYEMMVSLITFGYEKLGLTEQTAELRDLGDAHFSIELFRAVLDVVDSEHGTGETHDLRATLAQMQLGYVRAVESAGRPGRAQADGEREPDAPPMPTGEAAAAEPGRADGAGRASTADAAATGPSEESDAGDDAEAQPAKRSAARRKPAAKKKSAAEKPAAKRSTRRTSAPKKDAPVD